jgi:hypothetical protein
MLLPGPVMISLDSSEPFDSGSSMATRYKPRHPKPTSPVSTVVLKSRRRTPSRGGKRVARSTVKRPHPQIGESARLWNYVESEWIEGKIESIRPGYRVLVRCAEGLDETVGWHLAMHDGMWVEEIFEVAGTGT